MAKPKQELKFVFHNPNNEEQTEKMLTYYFVKANLRRMEKALAEAMSADKTNHDISK